jgi:hypothetical protein
VADLLRNIAAFELAVGIGLHFHVYLLTSGIASECWKVQDRADGYPAREPDAASARFNAARTSNWNLDHCVVRSVGAFERRRDLRAASYRRLLERHLWRWVRGGWNGNWLDQMKTRSSSGTLPTWGRFAPIQVNLTECLLSDIAKKPACSSFHRVGAQDALPPSPQILRSGRLLINDNYFCRPTTTRTADLLL